MTSAALADFGPDTGLVRGLLMGLEVPPAMTVSEWAEEYFMLSSEGSSEPGKFNPRRAAYQPGMLDAVNEPGINQVTLKTSAQVSKTTILLITLGYAADRIPGPMMFAMPTKEMAESFSKDRLSPAIRDVPRMAQIFPAEKARSSGNTIFHKRFPGGFLVLVGANSPISLRARSIRFALADEVDAWEGQAGKEGDPMELLKKRLTTFWDAKLLAASTPLEKWRSRISRLYDESDQRKFMVPCPECNTFQVLQWKIRKESQDGYKPTNIHWTAGKPATAHYQCEHCGSLLDDLQIKQAVRSGYWKATRPEVTEHAGFWVWALYSPWSSLPKIVAEYERAVGHTDRLKQFVNTTLGEEWEGEVIGTVEVAELLARRETYSPHVCPARAGLITAAVDVQHDRLEVQVIAWGLNDERWLLEHLQLLGDPNGPNVWKRCEETLLKRYPHELGHTELEIECVAIDSGGWHTQKAYDFAARNIMLGRLWYPIKGVSGFGKPIWKRSEISVRTGVRLILIGVDDAKLGVVGSLDVKTPDNPNYFHLPMSMTKEGLERLTAEKLVSDVDDKGFPKREWVKPEGARNEEFDCAVYNYAARMSLNLDDAVMSARLEQLSMPPAPPIDAAEVARMFKH